MTDKTAKPEDEQIEVELNRNLFVHCPKFTFSLRRAVLCKDCEYMKGLLKVSESENQVQAFRVYCGHPVTRSFSIVEED